MKLQDVGKTYTTNGQTFQFLGSENQYVVFVWQDNGEVEDEDGFDISFDPNATTDEQFNYSGLHHLPEHYAKAIRQVTGWPNVVSDDDFLYYLSTGDVVAGIESHVFATRNPAKVWVDCDGDERLDGLTVNDGELVVYCPTKVVVSKWYTACTEEQARAVDPEFFALMDEFCPLC